MVAKQYCDVAANSDTHEYKNLLLATKPNYTRGRVGCPSDTHPLKANSNAKKEKQSLPSIRKEIWCVAWNLVHVFSKAKNWRFAEEIKIYPKNSRSLLIAGIFVHRAGIALDAGMKAHCIILLRTRNDLVFQLADYLGMRWLLLIYPLYIWFTGSKYTQNLRPTIQWTSRDNLCRVWS